MALIACEPLLLLRMQFPSLRILARPGLFMIALLLLSALVGGGVIAPPLLVAALFFPAALFITASVVFCVLHGFLPLSSLSRGLV